MGKHKGFTLIEIVLFLGVTAALFIGITVGMQTSIARQRYDDAIQNFFEFMRSIYSQVSNPQSAGSGNSLDNAIYGKLVVFGENYDLTGSRITDSTTHPIFTYDVVGKAVGSQDVSSGDISQLLASLGANPFIITKNTSGQITKANLAAPEKYETRWQTDILNTGGSQFIGSILVVRHPRAGTINTLILENNAIQVNEQVNNINSGNFSRIPNLLTQYLSGARGVPQFGSKEIDFCVSSYSTNLPRQNIRLIANARNASGVEKVEADSEDNRCL